MICPTAPIKPYEIISSNGDFVRKFTNKRDVQKLMFFLGKSDLLFALSVDYPGLTKIDPAYVAAAKAELKRLGFKVERSDYKTTSKVYTYRIFYQGPRPGTKWYRPCSTRRQDATGFKIYFYGFPKEDAADVNKH